MAVANVSTSTCEALKQSGSKLSKTDSTSLNTPTGTWEEMIPTQNSSSCSHSLTFPDELLCPITKCLFERPVILVADGTTYEESALQDWLSENNISPLTGLPLETKEYRPNYNLRQAVEAYSKHLTQHKKERHIYEQRLKHLDKAKSEGSDMDECSHLGSSTSHALKELTSCADIEATDEPSDDNGAIQVQLESTDDSFLITPTSAKNKPSDTPATQRMVQYLTALKLGAYANTLITEGFIDLGDLSRVTFPDLIAMNIPRGHARRLLEALSSLHSNPAVSELFDSTAETNAHFTNSLYPDMPLDSTIGYPDASNSAMRSNLAPNRAGTVILTPGKIPKSYNAAPLNVNILMLGDVYVGKTSLRKRMELDEFVPTQATQGVELTCLLGTYQGENLQVTVWDPAGQERYASITKSFFRRAHGAAVVFSADDESSWKSVEYWMEELDNYASDDVESILICNKIDTLFGDDDTPLDDENKADEAEFSTLFTARTIRDENALNDVFIKNAIDVARRRRMPFFMTSCKSGECVKSAFQELVSQILANDAIVQKLYIEQQGCIAVKKANDILGKKSDSDSPTATHGGMLARNSGKLRRRMSDKLTEWKRNWETRKAMASRDSSNSNSSFVEVNGGIQLHESNPNGYDARGRRGQIIHQKCNGCDTV